MGPEGNKGYIGDTVLILHGTKTKPEHMKRGQRNYNHNYNSVNNKFYKNSLKMHTYYDNSLEDNSEFYDYADF